MEEKKTEEKKTDERAEEKKGDGGKDQKWLVNSLGHEAVPDLDGLGPMNGRAGRAGIGEKGKGLDDAALAADLDGEFRWKDLFAEVQQRNEAPALLIYSTMTKDRLLDAQMEHFLETYIRRHLSPARQHELEQKVRQQLDKMDAESSDLLEEVLGNLPKNCTEKEYRTFWKSLKFRTSIVKTVARRHNVDPDQPMDRLGLSLVRAVHSHNQPQNVATGDASGGYHYPAYPIYPIWAGPPIVGPTGAIGPTGPRGAMLSMAATGAPVPPTMHMDHKEDVPVWRPHAPMSSAAAAVAHDHDHDSDVSRSYDHDEVSACLIGDTGPTGPSE